MIRSVLSKRLRQFATTTPSAAYPVAAYPVVSSSRSNEQQLRLVFDSPEIATSSTTSSTGLFLQPRLESPADFPSLSERTILRAKLIVQKICLPPKGSHDSVEQVERAFLTMVKDLDRLSDLLCGVIDLAELVRNVHPEKGWNEGANEAYEGLCEYMNELNTNVVLYTVRRPPPSSLLSLRLTYFSRRRPSNLSTLYSQRPHRQNHRNSSPRTQSQHPSSATLRNPESIFRQFNGRNSSPSRPTSSSLVEHFY